MADQNPRSDAGTRDRWAAQIAALDGSAARPQSRKAPLSAERIVGAAFEIVGSEGFDALTMRRVSAALQTGPASLYAHVHNKAELDALMIGALVNRVKLPTPDAAAWRGQLTDVCGRLRDEYLRYPGIARAALAGTPTSIDTLRLAEGMLAILLAGGVAAQTAAWAIDAIFLYVSAYCLEASLARRPEDGVDGRVIDRDEIRERFRMLPPSVFPHTVALADELTAGDGHERFDFTIALLLGGIEGNAT